MSSLYKQVFPKEFDYTEEFKYYFQEFPEFAAKKKIANSKKKEALCINESLWSELNAIHFFCTYNNIPYYFCAALKIYGGGILASPIYNFKGHRRNTRKRFY